MGKSKTRGKSKCSTKVVTKVLLDIEDEPSDNYYHLRHNDVLVGRGNGIATFTGNRKFRSIVSTFKAEYVGAYRNEKCRVARVVMDEIEERGGRFVEKTGKGERVRIVDEKRALEKTCQCLREKLNVSKEDESKEIVPHPVTKKAARVRKKSQSPKKKSTLVRKKSCFAWLLRAADEDESAPDNDEDESAPEKDESGNIMPRPVTKKAARVRKKSRPPKKKSTFVKICVPRATIEPKRVTPEKETRARLEVPTPNAKHEHLVLARVASADAATKPEDGFEDRVQKLVDEAIEKKATQNAAGIVDDIILDLMPPELTTFFSGIISLSDRSISAVTGKGQDPGAPSFLRKPTAPGPASRGKSIAPLQKIKSKKNPHSPTNVAHFDHNALDAMFDPPAFKTTTSSAEFPELDLLEDTSREWTLDGFM
jgi:hypothetical protein